jgi:hypothetical protein
MALRARVGRHTRDGGRHCQNYPDDQQTVISLLNIVSISDGGSGGRLGNKVFSGVCSHELYRAISTFEDKHFPGQRSGYVDPGGAMLKRMETLAVPPARGPIDLVTAVDQYGLPTEPIKGKRVVISKTTRVIDSNQVMFVGIVGDSNNVVKAVVADAPNSVTIEDAGVIDGNRWFRLSRPTANTIAIQATDAKGSVVTSFALDGVLLPRVSGPNTPNAIDVTVYSPKDEDDYIDNKMNAIGYSIYYLGGFVVYCDGMSIPIHVPKSLVDLNTTKAEPIDAKVYDTLDQANEAIRLAPAKAEGVTPFAYYRGAGGAVIAPTIFSAVTTPRTIETFWLARVALKDYVQRELTGVAIGIVAGRVLRAVLGWIFRAPKNLKNPKPPRGAPPPPPPEPPAITRLRDTAVDLQNKNPVRSAEVLSAPRVYRHNLTADVPFSSYAQIEKRGSLSLSQGANAHYGEGVYAWPAGTPSTRPYIDIEVPPGTGVETLDVGGSRWVRIVPPNGDELSVRIVGTNLPQAQIDMGRKLIQ